MMKSYVRPSISELSSQDLHFISQAQTGQFTGSDGGSTGNGLTAQQPCNSIAPGQINLEIPIDLGIVPALIASVTGTLDVTVNGEVGNAGEFYTIFIEGNLLGNVGGTTGVAGCTSVNAALDLDAILGSVNLLNIVVAQLLGDGDIDITAVPSGAVLCVCAGVGAGNSVDVDLTLEASIL